MKGGIIKAIADAIVGLGIIEAIVDAIVGPRGLGLIGLVR